MSNEDFLDIKNCSCEKHLLRKSVLACEMRYQTQVKSQIFFTSLISEENNNLIYTTLLVIISLLLLVVISINCYYCYIKHWIKNDTYYLINID